MHAETSKGNLQEPDQGPSGMITQVALPGDDCQGEATQTAADTSPAVGSAAAGAPALVTDTTDAQNLVGQRASLKRKLGEYGGRTSSYKRSESYSRCCHQFCT